MNDFFVSLMLLGAVSSGGQMPFWEYSNQYDLMPRTSGYTAVFNTGMSYDGTKTFQWHWGVSAALRGDSFDGVAFIPDQAYAGVKWRCLSLDLGMKHPYALYYGSSRTLGSLSSTSGNIIMSGNARSMPGYTLSLHPVDFPWTKGHLQIAGAFGDYLMTDARYEGRTLTHNTQMYLIGNFGRFSLTLGIDHLAQWKGTGFADYLRVITGSSAGSGGSQSDRMNVIGNQLGAEKIALSYRGEGWTAGFRHDIPYDDKSGMRFKNFPDGVNTLSFSFDDKDRWVSDIVYEFQYTMWQSGPVHDPETDEHGNPVPWRPGLNFEGRDNYFNNGEFRSGWTHHGMTIGDPLFFPAGTRDGSWNRGITLGVENNRLRAHHLGLSGKIARRLPYRLMATYSINSGTYDSAFQPALRQFSFGFNCEVPLVKAALALVPGLYFDDGEVLKNTFGATLGIRYVFKNNY